MRMRAPLKLAGLLLLAGFTANGQINDQATILKHQSICFIQNNGQWHQNVNFRAPLGTGSVYLEDNVFTYSQIHPEDLDIAHVHSGEEHHMDDDLIDGHAWRTTFVGANPMVESAGEEKRTEYHNYFIGNDRSKWASHVPLYDIVNYDNLYKGIDMKVYSSNGSFKYDFVLAPNADPALIEMKYSGLDKIEIRNGNLVSFTTVGEFIENAPYAYQMINGVQKEVACKFVLEGNTVHFEFPEGYDKNRELIIDPELIGASLSGGTASNWGHCATYDYEENIYSGARCFASGYPTDDGSFQTDFGGGVDIAISKLSPDATTLLYATYIGGSGQDLPHSMVASEDNEIYVFGTTRSINYPVSDDGFDTTGPDGGLTSDIVVTHLTEDGSDIVGSTFVGGDEPDGQNYLTSNYGDIYRGEIVVDSDGNCYIASCTQSDNFPVTAGAYQETYGGGLQDGVVFSLSPDLSTMNWSTYIGGEDDEGALGLALDFDDNVYVSGVASDEFMTMTGYQTTYQGSDRDAFVIRLTDNGETISSSSFWGTTGRDAAFFVDLDIDGNVFLYGQSDAGLSEVTDGVYFNAGSHQFICKLSPDLADLEFGTVVGAGGANFVPTAFMVDACGYIYFSGHSAGGALPLTDDALFETGGFYLGVLQPEAIDLEFATLYSGNHVDGGTSRFDPENGMVYQAVCSCEPFTTTDGAFGAEDIVPGCDIGVFKIDFGITHVSAEAEVASSAEGCAPFTVDFENTGSGVSYEWNFDDGETSTDFEPSHTFTEAGVYDVRLVAFDPDACLTSDTVFLEIVVSDAETPEASFDYDINCATGEVSITYTGTDGVDFEFDMGDGATYDETEFTYTYGENGTYTVTLTAGDGICADFGTATEEIIINTPSVEVISNSPSCTGLSDGSVTLNIFGPTGEEVIEINNVDGTLLNVDGSNTANTLAAGWYYYHVDLGDGCELTDSIQLMDPPAINAQLNITNPLCHDDETGIVDVDTVFNYNGLYEDLVYIWTPDVDGVSGVGAKTITDLGAGEYTITINDDAGCTKVYTFMIQVPDPLEWADFGSHPAECRLYGYQNGNGVVYGAATGGTGDYHYTWVYLDDSSETYTNTTWGGRNPGTYELTAVDDNGCELTRVIELDSIAPQAIFTINSDQLNSDFQGTAPVQVEFVNNSIHFTDSLDEHADTTFFWNLDNPSAGWQISKDYFETFDTLYEARGQSYQVEVCLVALNKNGCKDTSCKMLTIYEPIVFTDINIFSPNGDGKNDVFTFEFRSASIAEFNCVIINRWGVQVAEITNITDGWDGLDRNGDKCKDGLYFYKYEATTDNGTLLNGQGNIQLIGSGQQ